MRFTGPTGTPAASNSRIQWAEGRARSRSAMSAVSAARFLMRSPLVRKRGSRASSGLPMTFTMRSQFDWFAPPTLIQPSAVGNAW